MFALMVTKNIWLTVYSSCILQKYLAAYMLIAVLLFVSVPHRQTEKPSHYYAFMCNTWRVSLERSKVSAALPFYYILWGLYGKSFPALTLLTEEALVSTHSI